MTDAIAILRKELALKTDWPEPCSITQDDARAILARVAMLTFDGTEAKTRLVEAHHKLMEKAGDLAAILAERDALAAEIARLRAAQWAVRHADTANDMVLMGMARDVAIAERDAQAAEIEKLREALTYAWGLVEDATYNDSVMMIRQSRFLSTYYDENGIRATLAQETQP
jgi:hypothetical protein